MEAEIIHYSNLSDLFTKIPDSFLKNQYSLIYRGIQNSEWQLTSTLHRYMDSLRTSAQLLKNEKVSVFLDSKTASTQVEDMLVKNLKANVSINGDLPIHITESFGNLEWLQYGQHFGLPSPLLDWTKSPYVALYFALQNQATESGNRAIWTLNTDMLVFLNTVIKERIYPQNQFYEYNYPLQSLIIANDSYAVNKRIAYQLGLFTREYRGISISEWNKRVTKKLDITLTSPLLQKHVWRNVEADRIKYLQVLDKMNINGRVLFPDIEGSVREAKENVLWGLIKQSTKRMSYKSNSDGQVHYETHVTSPDRLG